MKLIFYDILQGYFYVIIGMMILSLLNYWEYLISLTEKE